MKHCHEMNGSKVSKLEMNGMPRQNKIAARGSVLECIEVLSWNKLKHRLGMTEMHALCKIAHEALSRK